MSIQITSGIYQMEPVSSPKQLFRRVNYFRKLKKSVLSEIFRFEKSEDSPLGLGMNGFAVINSKRH